MPLPLLRARPRRTVLPALLAALALGACAQLPRPSVVGDLQRTPATPVVAAPANGAIFQSAHGLQPLFEDRRPRRPGDILTIVLDEEVSASKSSSASANRKGGADFVPAQVPDKLKKLSDFGLELSGSNDFEGKGGAKANNTFEGKITVWVAEVEPNGNLRVQGEKRIAINQGVEFIRFSGIVNPRTITAQNTVASTQVADARIEYTGDGYINEAQTMGWLQRFFLNVTPF